MAGFGLMHKYSIIFISTFAIFVSFLTPNINTGDAGELIASSYFMGVAHPSGYPLYLQIGKLFSFLPFGNIGFRVALVSALFSSLSLVLLAWLIQRLTEDKAAVFFTVAVLLVSYSYFTQSVIAKFYPLNLFLILLIFALWLNVFLRGYDENTLYMTAFIFGLVTANHHTGLMMAAALLPAIYFYRKALRWGAIPVLFLLWGAGFLINVYLLVRGGGDTAFFNSSYIRSFTGFWQVLLRLDYKDGSTVSAAGSIGRDFIGYWYAIRSFVFILMKNFSLFSFPLMVAGIRYLYKRERRFLIIALLALCLYGPFLAKLTFSAQTHTGEDYYFGANQYFLPAFAFYVFFLGMGFYQAFLWLKKTDAKILGRVLPVVFSVFPIFFLVSRATDSNYRTNHVPYQYAKDMHSILPINSVFMVYGDNAAYQGWYLKLVGRYREDNCLLSVVKGSEMVWTLEGCNKKLYKDIYPLVFNLSLNDKAPIMLDMRFYGTAVISDDFAFKKYMRSRIFSLEHIYLPTESLVKNINKMSPYVNRFIEERTLLADKLINPAVCVSHYTDDNFTGDVCNVYFPHLIEMANLYSDKKYGITGKSVEIYLSEKVLRSKDLYYKIPITEKNIPYLNLLNLIKNHNKWEIFYIR